MSIFSTASRKGCAALVLSLFTFFSASTSAGVRSVSLERVFTNGVTKFYDVSLRCTGDRAERGIRKSDEKGSLWCSKDVSSLCDKRKYTLARKICAYDAAAFKALQVKQEGPVVAAKAVSESEPVAANSVDKDKARLANELRREQMIIEAQRIQIEQRRLELVEQELGLKKQIAGRSVAGE